MCSSKLSPVKWPLIHIQPSHLVNLSLYSSGFLSQTQSLCSPYKTSCLVPVSQCALLFQFPLCSHSQCLKPDSCTPIADSKKFLLYTVYHQNSHCDHRTDTMNYVLTMQPSLHHMYPCLQQLEVNFRKKIQLCFYFSRLEDACLLNVQSRYSQELRGGEL